ncbi:type III effector [Pseudomonas beijingensis]|uniref:type III effector n=1 Tax=Pseudomonas beijingensis TaxID=2954101 RepID=UPI0027358B08|nr:type III effector [Pseudomonas sp. FP830]WLI45097.1 type III effector [Pseudomonas sp. FP830]
MPDQRSLTTPIRGTGALHGIDSLSRSPSLNQRPREAQQRQGSQSLHTRGRSSSTPPPVHQRERGRTRTRDANHAAAPNEAQPLDDAQTSNATPASRTQDYSFMSEMETRQKEAMEKQFGLQMQMEERQSALMLIKSSADMAKLMSDTVTEVTKGFMDSARKVMQEGGEAMKLR